MTPIFDERIPTSQLTVAGLENLLRALVARGLTDREIVGAYARRGAKIANKLLEVCREYDEKKERAHFRCGENPHFIAVLEPVG